MRLAAARLVSVIKGKSGDPSPLVPFEVAFGWWDLWNYLSRLNTKMGLLVRLAYKCSQLELNLTIKQHKKLFYTEVLFNVFYNSLAF